MMPVEYCIGMITSSTKYGLDFWEKEHDSEFEGPSEKDCTSHTTATAKHK
jgi:hypothetical protein